MDEGYPMLEIFVGGDIDRAIKKLKVQFQRDLFKDLQRHLCFESKGERKRPRVLPWPRGELKGVGLVEKERFEWILSELDRKKLNRSEKQFLEQIEKKEPEIITPSEEGRLETIYRSKSK